LKRNTATSILALTSAYGALALAPASALAQVAAAQTTATAKSSSEVGEVIVTAQKREQTIQSVGMSIQAVSGDALTNKGLDSTGDLTKLVPGLNAFDTGIQGAPGIGIRGVGYHDPSLAANPTVRI
jgi:outer membrane receptor protein involved in Fe transport